uniref:Uncharacterized protein n=1 Tax=Arundo donax TaxID=35708 RepID=A0A0A9DIC1_ARUDO
MPIQLLSGIFLPNVKQQLAEMRQQCSPLIVCLFLMRRKWEHHLYISS